MQPTGPIHSIVMESAPGLPRIRQLVIPEDAFCVANGNTGGVSDFLQHALHTAAASNAVLRSVAVFCGTLLLFVQAAGFAAVAVRRRSHLDWRVTARIIVSGVVAVAITQVLLHVIRDPRPYLAEQYVPLAHVSADNGFPSDHTLVAALLTGWAAWLSRRSLPAFLTGLILIALGRLAIGAHHTLDIVGSVGIAALALGLAWALPYPALWTGRPVLPPRPVTHAPR
jgi:undecaprenyl-diphosphatase